MSMGNGLCAGCLLNWDVSFSVIAKGKRRFWRRFGGGLAQGLGLGGGGGWHEVMVYCSRLQLAVPTGRWPFAALPLDAFPP